MNPICISWDLDATSSEQQIWTMPEELESKASECHWRRCRGEFAPSSAHPWMLQTGAFSPHCFQVHTGQHDKYTVVGDNTALLHSVELLISAQKEALKVALWFCPPLMEYSDTQWRRMSCSLQMQFNILRLLLKFSMWVFAKGSILYLFFFPHCSWNNQLLLILTPSITKKIKKKSTCPNKKLWWTKLVNNKCSGQETSSRCICQLQYLKVQNTAWIHAKKCHCCWNKGR